MINNDNEAFLEIEQKPFINKSDIFSVLQNERRRMILEILHKDGPKSLRDISEAIARIESKSNEPVSNVRKSIYVSMLQTHLPKMENMGIIIYNRDIDRLELTPAAEGITFYLEPVKKGDIPWSHFYLGFSTISIVGTFFISFNFPKSVYSIYWMVFTNVIFLVTSIFHVNKMKYYKRK
ncbi:winged helix-turn-helix domain-containing protein [uncultured Methanomethylovorans sp.]|uniref:winged helix-turn-helix domain-containing protein n=1 Tax=uncultured Methanomethylovorans sp. TaxID=183759 RepID=UPI002AA78848|nr:winged helix-turn-helix domain-containing protein [uncultured Methanomethylovorans sp.]